MVLNNIGLYLISDEALVWRVVIGSARYVQLDITCLWELIVFSITQGHTIALYVVQEKDLGSHNCMYLSLICPCFFVLAEIGFFQFEQNE